VICKECAWEADLTATGDVLVYAGHGHEACEGCDCHHKPVSPVVQPLDGIDGYTEALQKAWERVNQVVTRKRGKGQNGGDPS
jgi:hypothetical protein